MDTGEENLQNFMKDLNNIKFYLKFAFECDRSSINLLDLNVKFNNRELAKTVYIKPTYRHQYLRYRSFHPNHMKLSIVYSQTLRANRLCLFKEDFVDHSDQMKNWFSK